MVFVVFAIFAGCQGFGSFWQDSKALAVLNIARFQVIWFQYSKAFGMPKPQTLAFGFVFGLVFQV